MTSSTPLWDALTTAALVGTERKLPPLPTSGPALAAFVAALDPADAEGRLLALAAAEALRQRAGFRPAPTELRPAAPCPPETAPPCPPRAADHLATMLGGLHRELIPEWLQALAASGRVAPPAQLPALLALGRAEADLRPLVLPILGERGRWLAALNPAWDYVAAVAPAVNTAALTARWETGSRSLRQGMLQQLRASQPDAARALVESSWSSERADERSAMITTFAVGLSMADEPFLDAALDDRSSNVRAEAADLLARLPGSRLAARMVERALPLLRFTPGEGARLLGLRPAVAPRLAVELPEAIDKPAQRDGIERKASRPGVGERAWWFAQILARTPPATWEQAFHAPPATIVRATIDPDWRRTVLEAWSDAAERYRDVAWAEALVDLALESDAPGVSLPDLLALLPPARQEQLILGLFSADHRPLSSNHRAFPLLRDYDHPWSRQLGEVVLDSLARRLAGLNAKQSFNDWPLFSALEQYALALPVALAPQAAALARGQGREIRHLAAAIERFETIVSFRYQMHAALSSA